MKDKLRFWLILSLSIILALRILASIVYRNYDFFWFCVINLALLIIALYKKNNPLFSSILVSSLVMEIFRTIDLISYALTKKLLFNVANYLTEISTPDLIIGFYHFALIIVPFYYIIKGKKFYKHAWIISSILFLFASLATLTLTDTNANCARDSCHIGEFNVIYYLKPAFLPWSIFHWLAATILIFIPTNYILHTIFKKSLLRRQSLYKS